MLRNPGRKNVGTEFGKGFVKENPLFRLALGMCPALAVTTNAYNALGMGLAATFVLLGSNTIISLIKGFIPQKVRIPSFIVIIATFVTIVDLLIHAFFPPLHKALGIFIPLIVVNCIILARAEAFASKNTVLLSVVDALGMGAGFTAALLLLGGAREVLGSGTFFGMKVGTFSPALVMILPPGAFLLLGLYLSFFNWMGARR